MVQWIVAVNGFCGAHLQKPIISRRMTGYGSGLW